MFVETSFNKTNYLLEKGLDVSLIRHQVISDNIANADTPFFKRMDVSFESQLKRALDSEKIEPFPTKITNEKHILFFKPIPYREVRPRLNVEFDTNMRNDKNNVDIEKEISDSIKNTLRYRAMVQRISKNFRMLTTAMQ